LSADLEVEKVRANRADGLETELASAQEMIEDLQHNRISGKLSLSNIAFAFTSRKVYYLYKESNL
jgi:hypothetical protein